MESKLIIVLAFASLAHSSDVPTLGISYDLSEDQVADLNGMIINQEAATTAFNDAVENIFNVIDKSAAAFVFDLEARTDDDSSKLATALVRMKDAVDLFLDSVQIAVRGSCPNVQDAQNAIYGYLDDSVAQLNNTIKLAKSGYNSENRAAIEANQAAVHEDVTNVMKTLYGLISTCRDTTDADTLAVLGSAQDESRDGFINSTNAVFNALKVYAAAATIGYVNVAHIPSDIQDYRGKASIGFRAVVEYTFSALKALYIDSCLNQTDIVSVLYANQRALTGSYEKYRKSNEIVIYTVRDFLIRIYLGLEEDGNYDFTRMDVELGTVIATSGIGDGENLDCFSLLHPNSSATIASAREQIHTVTVAGDTAVFNAITTAATRGANYPDVLANIDILRNSTVSTAPIYTGVKFDVILGDEVWDNETEAKLANFRKKTVDGAILTSLMYFDAIEILANATHTGQVTEDAFSAIEALLKSANSGMMSYTQGLSAGAFTVLEANRAI